MVNKIYTSIERKATWPVAALLVLVMLVANQGFSWRKDQLGQQNQVLDVRRWHTPEQAAQLFKDLADKGALSTYAISEVTLDLAFPLAYGFLFAILIARLWGKQRSWMVLIPLGAMVFDLLENFTIATLALSYNGSPSSLAWLAAICTLFKMVLFVASLLLILAGGLRGVFLKD